MRVTNGPARLRKKRRLLKRAKGFVGGRSKLLRTAKETVRRAMRYATRDRKVRKRDFRSLWIVRINAATRAAGMSYSMFIAGLRKLNIVLDRKQLAEMAVNDAESFASLIEKVKTAA